MGSGPTAGHSLLSLNSAMPGYPCPTCGRALHLGDDLWGARVQCPLCGTEFQAPSEPRLPQPRLPRPIDVSPAPRPGGRIPPDYFEPKGDRLGPRQEAALRSAATWLRITVLLQGISGLFCCCGP